MWGLPFSTLLLVIGLPVIIIIGLVCWGMKYKVKE